MKTSNSKNPTKNTSSKKDNTPNKTRIARNAKNSKCRPLGNKTTTSTNSSAANSNKDANNNAAKNPRAAYQGETLLSANRTINCDTWQSGLNNNVLVLGCSGGGKTRNHIKPNLLQCQGSYIVLDCKGSLYREVGPFLEENGYVVDCINFTTMGGTIGYNPLAHIRWSEGLPLQQDIISIAATICPIDEHETDPFWPQAAANYLTAYIAYVLEAMPEDAQNLASVIRVFELAAEYKADSLFEQLEKENPYASAPSLYRRSKVTRGAEKMHSSIQGIIAADLLPFGFKGAVESYENQKQVDFSSFGREKRALFVTIDDLDRSLDKLINLFIHQAFSVLCRSADNDHPEHRLAVPVRFILDDFANLRLPRFDDVLSVIRSREISCTVVCQTISQLEARYGEATANSIVGNCDSQLVLAFQDERTANYYACRANKTASTLLETPADMWWIFIRGQRGAMEPALRLEDHPRYPQLLEAQQHDIQSAQLEFQRKQAERERMMLQLEEEFGFNLEEDDFPIVESIDNVA